MQESAQRGERRRRQPTPEFTWEDLATALLPVVACFLGGATEKWAEGIVVCLLGLLLLLNPPRFSLGVVVNGAVVALLGCAAIAYLPARWFTQPAWRQALRDDFGIKLVSNVTPQPWITAGCLLSLVAGLCWFYYVAGQEVEVRAVRRQLRLFAFGVIVLAALAVALHLAHTALPFWHNERNFGPFPNRNQTGNLFGIASVLILACAHDDIRRHKKRWILWLAGLAIVIAAIVMNFSRAGLAILLVGSALYVAVLLFQTRSTARIAIGASALLVLVTVLLIFGGQTLERFNLRGAAGASVASDFRWLIFRDAFQLIRASPWGGIGLGNFQPVFAMFRVDSVGQSRALHPESDWIWLWVELGWPGVLLILLGAAALVRQVFPFGEGSAQWFRKAALIGAILFALHGLVDVAGHRVGTAYAGVFLFGLSLRRPLRLYASPWLTNGARVAGALLVVVGATWITAQYRGLSLPGGLGVDRERQLGMAANVGRLHQEMIAHATQGLGWAPLDWQLYFLRALGKVGAKAPTAEALDDFRRARFLEPNSFEVPYQEGMAWLVTQPALTMTAWREALHRAGAQRPELYSRMLSNASQRSPAVTRMLQEFGSSQHDLALAFLERAQREDFTTALERLLAHDPALETLTPEEKRKLFSLWEERGDLERLLVFVQQNPDAQALAWRGVAAHKARRQDFAGAVALARQYGVRPVLPQIVGGSSTEQLQRNLFANPGNYDIGFALYHQQMEEGKIDDALLTVRRLAEQPGCPAYFHFLEAETWVARNEWERAWAAQQKFEAAKK